MRTPILYSPAKLTCSIQRSEKPSSTSRLQCLKPRFVLLYVLLLPLHTAAGHLATRTCRARSRGLLKCGGPPPKARTKTVLFDVGLRVSHKGSLAAVGYPKNDVIFLERVSEGRVLSMPTWRFMRSCSYGYRHWEARPELRDFNTAPMNLQVGSLQIIAQGLKAC